MGDIFGGGGGGGSSGVGDSTDSKTKSVPSPAAIAAMRAAANTASGVAGTAKNLPYYAQVASSPGYRQALQNTANTWSDWMGTQPMDLSQGMAPISQGQFGSVIDSGKIMNEQMGSLPPAIQYMLAQWTGPGEIGTNSPYAPINYNPYVSQPRLMSAEADPTGAGGSGHVGAGGIPNTTLPSPLPPSPYPQPPPPPPPPPGPGPTPGPGPGPGPGPRPPRTPRVRRERPIRERRTRTA